MLHVVKQQRDEQVHQASFFIFSKSLGLIRKKESSTLSFVHCIPLQLKLHDRVNQLNVVAMTHRDLQRVVPYLHKMDQQLKSLA